jgi:hypothetical protein
MATSLVSRSTISLPRPSFSSSLKSARLMAPFKLSLASASRPMILLIRSPISLSPFAATMSTKLPPGGTSIRASGSPRYLSETYFMNSSTRT